MANLRGTNVSAAVVPFTDQDRYATHEDIYGKGGYRVVETLAARNAISSERRKVLMKVSVTEDGKTYTLKTNPEGNTTDTDWEEDAVGGTTNYDDLTNKPTSSVADIDDAVAKKHSHVNSLVLNKFTEQNDVIFYNGQPISTSGDTYGGEFATKADLMAYATPYIGYSYIVTSDEDQSGLRTYYKYITGGTWVLMGTFSDVLLSGGSNSYNMQWNSPSDIVAGTTKVLPTPYTSTFNVVAPTVLKFESGEQNIVKTVSEFDNGSATSFKYDPNFVEFVGTDAGSGSQMRLKTNYTYPFVKDTTWTGTGQYAECDIDMSVFKSVESITVR